MNSSNYNIFTDKTVLVITFLFIICFLSPQKTLGQTATKSITLNWTAPGDDGSTGIAAAYDIRYSTSLITDANWDAATQITNEPTPQPTGSQESFVIDSLEPNSIYYFAIKTSDEAFNWSTLSNVISKTTDAESTAPSAIASLSVSSPTDSSVTLSWTAVGDDGNIGQASQYEIRYSTSPITSINWSSATIVGSPPTPNVAGTSETFVVSGLIQETTYYFAVKTADEVPNWSELSNVVSTTTIDLTAPAAIIDLSALTSEANGVITLNWTAPGDDNMLGTAAVYEIRYSLNQITDSNWLETSLLMTPPSPLPAGEQQSTELTGLTPGQFYYIAMKSYDNSQNSSVMSNTASAEAGFNLATDIDDNENNIPTDFALAQNYPNPFNPSTTIGFALPTSSHVELTVYNIEGKKVKTLVDYKLPAGQHSIEWDGTNNNGSKIATGVYIYRIFAETFSATKKMVLLK